MRSDLPTGTVTFLFTDVEGSTKLLRELGAETYADALADHRHVIRAAGASHGGVEVDTQGDAFFFAFPTASGALAAASDLTEALAPGPVRVRVGLHTGTPLVAEEGYVGHDVHRASRIATAGHGGQVLVSASTASLLENELRDLGEHRFKDLAAPERVYQLGGDEFPSLKSLYRTNLPVPATPFLGRERELAEVVTLLNEGGRVLTLTGPGGTGKTRLALQAVAEASDHYPDGVYWVPLAPLHDPALVLPAVAQTLEVKEEPGTPLAECLQRALAGKQALLLLDNVEHLLPTAAAELAGLQLGPGPVLVVTSRERLQLPGEQVYPVPTLADRDGVDLFLARARALAPGFAADGAVAELCSRLENLPLALELAAARTVVFSPEQLLGRLSQRLDLLRAGRIADPRQQTLRATIEWSYDLLDEGERRLFEELSVFAGGSTYEAAEQICGADPDLLQSLLDKSLLRRRDTDLGPRYWMLETIREFASERLTASGELERTRNRHLEWFAQATHAQSRASRLYEEEAHGFLRADQPNIREALSWAVETGAAERAQHILIGAFFHWIISGLAAQGDEWASRVVALESPPSEDYAWALGIAGEFPRVRGEPARALELKERAIATFETIGLDDPRVARRVAFVYTDASDVLAQLGDFEQAVEYAERALAIRRELGIDSGIAHALGGAGLVAEQRGAPSEAVPLYEEAIALLESCGEPLEAAWALEGLGSAKRALGDLSGARTALEEALRRAEKAGDRMQVAYVLGTLGLVAADAEECACAVGLLARATEEARDAALLLPKAGEIDGALVRCRENLGEDRYRAAYDSGVAAAVGASGQA